MARPAPPPRRARRPPQLVMQDSALLDPARQAALLDQIRAAGGTGIQQDVIWGDVRAGGQYDPAKMQALRSLFTAANQRGLHPQVRLIGTPQYMAQNRPGVDTTLSWRTPNTTVAQTFAHDMAQQFGGLVSQYSAWNEPNGASFLRGSPRQQALEYRRLYQAMRTGVKSANPNARVMLGEVTTGGGKGLDRNTYPLQFLRNVLAAGNKPLVSEGFALHPYQWSNPKVSTGIQGFGGIADLPQVQHLLADMQRRHKLTTRTGGRVPLSLTEFGYKHDAVRDPRLRAAYLQRSLALARQAGVRQMNLYQLVPSKAGDYWDSSIANLRGQISPRVLAALRRGRGL